MREKAGVSDDSQLPDGQWSPRDCVLLVGC